MDFWWRFPQCRNVSSPSDVTEYLELWAINISLLEKPLKYFQCFYSTLYSLLTKHFKWVQIFLFWWSFLLPHNIFCSSSQGTSSSLYDTQLFKCIIQISLKITERIFTVIFHCQTFIHLHEMMEYLLCHEISLNFFLIDYESSISF